MCRQHQGMVRERGETLDYAQCGTPHAASWEHAGLNARLCPAQLTRLSAASVTCGNPPDAPVCLCTAIKIEGVLHGVVDAPLGWCGVMLP